MSRTQMKSAEAYTDPDEHINLFGGRYASNEESAGGYATSSAFPNFQTRFCFTTSKRRSPQRWVLSFRVVWSFT